MDLSASSRFASRTISTNPDENPSNVSPDNPNLVNQFDPVKDLDANGKPSPEDPSTPEHPFGEDVEAFARFTRSTKAPPTTQNFIKNLAPDPDNPPFQPGDVAAGKLIFGTNIADPHDTEHLRSVIDNPGIGCVICHRERFVTPATGFHIHSIGHDHAGPKQFPGTDLRDKNDEPTVPEALGNWIIRPYSDFMLHDIGTGDGIVQTQFAQNPPMGEDDVVEKDLTTMTERIGATLVTPATIFKNRLNQIHQESNKNLPLSPGQYRMIYIKRSAAPGQGQQAARARQGNVGRRLTEKDFFDPTQDAPLDQRTRNKVRTAPLWGLRVRPQLLHDGSAFSIDEAIRRHQGEAAEVEARYEVLTDLQKRQLFAFLNSLGFDNRPGEGPPHVTAGVFDENCPRPVPH